MFIVIPIFVLLFIYCPLYLIHNKTIELQKRIEELEEVIRDVASRL